MAYIPKETPTVVQLEQVDEPYLEKLGLKNRVKDGKIECKSRQEALQILIGLDEAQGNFPRSKTK